MDDCKSMVAYYQLLLCYGCYCLTTNQLGILYMVRSKAFVSPWILKQSSGKISLGSAFWIVGLCMCLLDLLYVLYPSPTPSTDQVCGFEFESAGSSSSMFISRWNMGQR